MPKVGKIGKDDIEFGLGTFNRTSRLNPSNEVTKTQVNAGHISLSANNITASQVAEAFGEVNTSAQWVGGVSVSNEAAISGIVTSNDVANIKNTGVTGSGYRMDAGQAGFSGYAGGISYSTALSTINYVAATVNRVAGLGGNITFTSGQASKVVVAFSGHTMDIYPLVSVSAPAGTWGTMTSAGTSNVISWVAIGI